MQLITPVALSSTAIRLTPRSVVMCAGSCFADHMGERLRQSLPPQAVCVNPSGVLYNPISLSLSLDAWMQPSPTLLDEGMFQADDRQFRHWLFSTRFEAATPELLRPIITEAHQQAHSHLLRSQVLFITFSTDHVFFLQTPDGNELPVANCHKMPSRLFSEQVVSGQAMLERWQHTLRQLHVICPQLHVVFTLSPYRYAKHGLHQNALSKARLLLLIDALCETFPFVEYFPAYEIITDELRDYRFYAPDMLHPSEQAVDYVWERFRTHYFTPALSEFAHEQAQLLRDESHRPLHPESETYRLFQLRCQERRIAFEQKWGLHSEIHSTTS
ncbi:MAG: GSCFA domain-containing protein [Bacteroidales bacterium]|nr:GSCFA domain-containing protein [Bacteroidales bacterium]